MLKINKKSFIFYIQGEYLIRFKGIVSCQQPNLTLHHNLYLSKKSTTVTEIKGNLTIEKQAFDDTLSVSMIMICN